MLKFVRSPAQVLVSPGAAADKEEESFYASPEELLSAGAAATPRSDVYSLGVLFFELFNPVPDAVARRRALRNLRHRILPLALLQVRRARPTARDTLYQLFLPGT